MTVAVEFIEVVIEADAEKDVDERGEDVEVVVVNFVDVELPDFWDVEAARVVNGSVLTCAASPNWKRFCPKQQAAPGVVSQQ
jgi:hypothetical protein